MGSRLCFDFEMLPMPVKMAALLNHRHLILVPNTTMRPDGVFR